MASPLLSSDMEHASLEAFLSAQYPLLVPLLPSDTEAIEIFKWVDSKRDVREYFNAPETDSDGAVKRSFLRFTIAIEERLKEEEHILALKKRREKHAAEQAKMKVKQQTREERKRKIEKLCPQEPPPPPPSMTLQEAATVATVRAAERDESARDKLLAKGFTACWVGPKEIAGDHVKYFWSKPQEAAQRLWGLFWPPRRR